MEVQREGSGRWTGGAGGGGGGGVEGVGLLSAMPDCYSPPLPKVQAPCCFYGGGIFKLNRNKKHNFRSQLTCIYLRLTPFDRPPSPCPFAVLLKESILVHLKENSRFLKAKIPPDTSY